MVETPTFSLRSLLLCSPSAALTPIFESYSQELKNWLLLILRVTGGFNVHKRELLTYSFDISAMGRSAEHCTVVSNLSRLIDLPTCARDRFANRAYLLGVISTFILSCIQMFLFFPLLARSTVVIVHIYQPYPAQLCIHFCATIQPPRTIFVNSQFLSDSCLTSMNNRPDFAQIEIAWNRFSLLTN